MMTERSRFIIAIVGLILGVALIIVGVLADNGQSATTAGSAATALILGYVFGDRNGEKRLAAALTVLEAEDKAPGSTSG